MADMLPKLLERMPDRPRRAPEPTLPPPVGQDDPPSSAPVGCWLLPLTILLFLGLGFGYWSNQNPIIRSNWEPYERVFHENLKRNLSKGIRLDFSDPSWVNSITPPTSLNLSTYDWTATYIANGRTTDHLPGVPAAMALSNYLLLALPATFSTLAACLVATALAFLVDRLRREYGWLAFGFAITILLIDGYIFQSTWFAAGDAIVTALTTLTFLMLLHGVDSKRESRRAIWAWPIGGALLGAATLFQIQPHLWLPWIFAVWIGGLAYSAFHQRPKRLPNIEAFLLFWIGVTVVAAPWWIRNIKATGEFRPVGTVVATRLVGSYFDGSLANSGNIDGAEIISFRAKTLQPVEFSDTTLIEKEILVANASWSASKSWAASHPGELAGLIWLRLTNHFGLTANSGWMLPFNLLTLVVCVVGCIARWQNWGRLIFAAIAISALVTAVTWSDYNRLLIPVRPLIDIGCSIGVVHLIRQFWSRHAESKHETRLATDRG